MSRPIKLTEELIQQIQKEFISDVRNTKMLGGELTYRKAFKWSDTEKASITFTAVAFAKMMMLVQQFDSEVAWHGVAYRDRQNRKQFYITDILVYPQLVTGGTVNTDQEAYTDWLYGQDDEVFNNIRMQGHSHVNFSTTPSAVDTTHQEKILAQLDDDMFYIFMIWNKKLERTIKIFDLQNNTLYENEDINVFIGDDGTDLDAFVATAKEIVKPKPYQKPGFAYGQSYSGGQAQSAPATTPKTKEKPKGKKKDSSATPKIGSGYGGRAFAGGYDDEEDYYGGYGYGMSYR